MRVVLIQSKLEWEQPAVNRAVFAEKISKLSAKADLIVLPEMCTTGFSMNAEALAEPMGGGDYFMVFRASPFKRCGGYW